MLFLLSKFRLIDTNLFLSSRRLFHLTQSVGLKKSNDYIRRLLNDESIYILKHKIIDIFNFFFVFVFNFNFI